MAAANKAATNMVATNKAATNKAATKEIAETNDWKAIEEKAYEETRNMTPEELTAILVKENIKTQSDIKRFLTKKRLIRNGKIGKYNLSLFSRLTSQLKANKRKASKDQEPNDLNQAIENRPSSSSSSA